MDMGLFHRDSQKDRILGTSFESHGIVVSHFVATCTLPRGVFSVLFKRIKGVNRVKEWCVYISRYNGINNMGIRNYLVMTVLIMFLVSCNHNGKTSKSTDTTSEVVNAQSKTFECEQFSVSYPNGYYAKVGTDDTGSDKLFIGRDSTDIDMTSITWISPGTFPGNVKDFVTFATYKEMEDYEASNTFYDVMLVDSTYTIDGYPTYTISSIFTEGNDTVIQSRTGLIIPDKLNMIIIQRTKTKQSMDEVQKMTDIIQSIKIKE